MYTSVWMGMRKPCVHLPLQIVGPEQEEVRLTRYKAMRTYRYTFFPFRRAYRQSHMIPSDDARAIIPRVFDV